MALDGRRDDAGLGAESPGGAYRYAPLSLLGSASLTPSISTQDQLGQALTDEVIAATADAAYAIAKPMDNTDFELVWRKKMVKTLVTNALRELRGDDMREARLKLAKQTLA